MKRTIAICTVISIAVILAATFAPAQVEEYAGAIVRAWNYLYVKSGGELQIETGGTFTAESGSTVNFDAGSTLSLDDDAALAFGVGDATAGINASASNEFAIGPILGGFADYRGLPSRIEWDWIPGSRGLPTTAGLVAAGTNDQDLVVEGTNASADDVIYATAQGGIQLQTDGADGDEVILYPYKSDGAVGSSTPSVGMVANTNWRSDKGLRFETILTTGQVNKGIIWTGLKQTNTEVIATDNEGVYFRTENDSAIMPNKWVAIFNRAGVDYQYDTGLTFARNTQYHFAIDIDKDQLPHFYINGALVASGTTTVITGINLWPTTGIATDGAAADMNITVQRQRLSQKF